MIARCIAIPRFTASRIICLSQTRYTRLNRTFADTATEALETGIEAGYHVAETVVEVVETGIDAVHVVVQTGTEVVETGTVVVETVVEVVETGIDGN